MISFTQDDFTLLNYKDDASPFTTLWRINTITIEEVATPTIGANYVMIRESGQQECSGSPFGGGIIYLQNQYCAIAYEKGKGGFDIKLSSSFQPKDLWAKIMPTNYYSTPMARLMKECPESVLLLPDGCLATMPDSQLYGTSADYLAVNNGVLCGAFGVKERTYFGMFFPQTGDTNDYVALARYLYKQGPSSCYTTAKDVSGLVVTPSVKQEALRVREIMKKAQLLTVDYSKATAFAAPLSLSLTQNATVNSALCRPNALRYMEQQSDGSQDGESKIVGLVMNSQNLTEAITLMGFESTIVEYLKSVKCNDNVLALIDGDFQEILNNYHLIYLKTLGEVSYNTFVSLKGTVEGNITSVNRLLPMKLKDFIVEKLSSSPEAAAIASKIEGEFPGKIALPTLYCQEPAQDGSNAEAILAEAIDIVKQYAHDSDVPDEGEFDLKKTPPIKELTNDSDVLNSFLMARAIATHGGPMVVNLESVSLAENVEIGHPDIAVKKCRFLEIDNFFGLGTSNHGPEGRSHHTALSAGTAKANVTRAYLSANQLVLDYRLSTTAWYDQTCYNELEGALKTMYETYRDRLADIMHISSSSFQLRTIHKGKDKWKICSPYEPSCPSDNKDYYVDFTVRIAFPSSEVLSLSTPETTVAVLAGTSFSTSTPLDKPLKIAEKVRAKITEVAANAAYKSCEYLFKSLKDAYTYEPIGMLSSDYSGVVVSLKDLGRVAKIDEAYVNKIVELISLIQDTATREALMPFCDSIRNAQAAWKTQGLIYYTDYKSVMSADPVTDTNAIVHYVLGGMPL